MFLDEYPLWEVGGLHFPVILQGMFLQGTHLGQKEAEQMICQGHQQSLPKLNSDFTDIPAMQLVGYRTSCEEIRNLFHEVHLLRRPPGLLPYRQNGLERLPMTSSTPEEPLRGKEGSCQIRGEHSICPAAKSTDRALLPGLRRKAAPQ